MTQLSWLDSSLAAACELSPAQREVLSCLAAGMDIRSTASALRRSERMVKAHTTAILSRLGVCSRLQAGIVGYHLVMQGELELPRAAFPRPDSVH